MTEQLKFEVGKHYRTRSGDKLLCVHVFPPRKALFVNELAKTYGTRWPDGRVEYTAESPHDIVSEWRESRQWTVYVVDCHGGTVATTDPGNRAVLAKGALTEGEGLE
jgi:hypothetical protein